MRKLIPALAAAGATSFQLGNGRHPDVTKKKTLKGRFDVCG